MLKIYESKVTFNRHLHNIDNNRVYLYPGVYRLFCKAKRYTWKREKSWKKWATSLLFDSGNSFRQAIKIIMLSKKYTISEINMSSCGDEIYVTRKKQLKIFDHDSKQVHYYPFSSEILERAERFDSMYAPFFEGHIIENINKKGNYITERYIVEDLLWRESKETVMHNIKKIWNALIEYTNSVSDKKVVVTMSDFTDKM